MFVLLCGGPYGVEPLIRESGPGLGLGILAAAGIVWAVPYALVTAELTALIPKEGGIYHWFKEGIDGFWAFQLTWAEWVAWVLDSALYPVIFASYTATFLVSLLQSNGWVSAIPSPGESGFGAVVSLFAVVMIWATVFLNLRGVKSLGRASVWMTLFLLLPCIIVIIAGMGDFSWDLFPLEPPEGVGWQRGTVGALVFAVWNYSGYQAISSAAEEVVDPQRNFPRALAIFVPITILVYTVTLAAAVVIDPATSLWTDSHLEIAAKTAGGVLLAGWIAIAGQLSSISLFASELMITSRLIFAVALDGKLPAALARLHPKSGVPVVAVVAQATVCTVLVLLMDFVELLLVGTWVSMVIYAMIFSAVVIFRIKRPNDYRAFKIPGGWLGLSALLIGPLAIIVAILALTGSREIIISLPLLFGGLPLYFLFRLWMKRSSTVSVGR